MNMKEQLLKQAEQLNDRAFHSRMQGHIDDHEFMTLMQMVSSMIEEAEKITEVEDND